MAEPLDPALVSTEAARELLRRPRFPAIGRRKALGDHIAVNAYDLARVERAAASQGDEGLRLAPDLATLRADVAAALHRAQVAIAEARADLAALAAEEERHG